MGSQLLNNFIRSIGKKERSMIIDREQSNQLLDNYIDMINGKTVSFVDDLISKDSDSEDFDSINYRYGTIESINEELGEVVRADRILNAMSLSDEGWSQDSLLEELGDLIFNISVFASYRGINLDTILEYNIRKVEARG